MQDETMTLKPSSPQDKVKVEFHPAKKEIYVCPRCKSSGPSAGTILIYHPSPKRLCPVCRFPVVKASSKEGKKLLQGVKE